MTEAAGIFSDPVPYDPAGDFDAFAKQLPARWAVYLVTDVDDRPVQLLMVKNLRESIRRRLGPPEADALPSKRIDYRDLVRFVRYRRVDSAFEADWIYYEAARKVFPHTYQGMVGFRPAWFVHVNPETNFPRYTKSIDPTGTTGVYFGPLEDKHAAARLMQLAEDSFDLCRYYNILVEAPHGKACAYKEMGRCPAPCDGTVSMGAYRQLVELSVRTLIDPRPAIADQEKRMRAAAAELKFEMAGRIKQHLSELEQIGKGPFRYAKPLEDFRYLTLQHGPEIGSAKAYVVTPGGVEHVASIVGEPAAASGLLRRVFECGQSPLEHPMTVQQVERVGVVSHHLFSPKSTHGVFLPLADVEDKSLLRAYRELMKQKRAESSEGEDVEKELTAQGEPGVG